MIVGRDNHKNIMHLSCINLVFETSIYCYKYTYLTKYIYVQVSEFLNGAGSCHSCLKFYLKGIVRCTSCAKKHIEKNININNAKNCIGLVPIGKPCILYGLLGIRYCERRNDQKFRTEEDRK